MTHTLQWLQVGNAMQSTHYDPFDLLQHTTPRIIISPTDRLNLFGFLGGAICNFATQLKFVLGYDDALDVRSPPPTRKIRLS